MTSPYPAADSSGFGFVQPNVTMPAPLAGTSLANFLQQMVSGITGIDQTLVRPRWQTEPPNRPAQATNWAAIGVERRRPEGFVAASVGHTVLAAGCFVFSGQPAAGDTITLGTTAVQFVTGTPSGNQIQIGAAQVQTLQNVLAFLSASQDSQILLFQGFALLENAILVQAVARGTAGNSLAIAASSAAIMASGATLTGGTGHDYMFRAEDIELLASLYGPQADDNALLLHDGLMLRQNREILTIYDMALIEVGDALRVPELINSQWYDRVDLPIHLRRSVHRDYPIRTIIQAQGVVETDMGYAVAFSTQAGSYPPAPAPKSLLVPPFGENVNVGAFQLFEDNAGNLSVRAPDGTVLILVRSQ